ncbi:MAG: HAD-IIA family hydrolase [Clostridiales bacterium]|nr:HAD-IIA family hydrolase [Candidatus Coliplasma equi]
MEKSELSKIKLFVLDMDGTIYLGDKVLPGAVEFVHTARKSGRKVIFFTNNASKNPNNYVEKLERLGFGAVRSDVVTAGDVTIEFLKRHRPGKSVYLVGTPALEESFKSAGIELSEKSDIVVTSFDTTLTYEKLVIACDLIRNGAEFLCTHPDFNCPTETGFIPDSGAIAALVTASTGVQPKYFGKPYKETADMIYELFGVPFEETAIVGDRIYTDIALGKNNGINSVLVLTGETKLEDVNESNAPDIILDGICDITRYM